MKRLLAYLFIVLGLGLTFNVYANDIRDFEIKGTSIGDSLLDHFKIKTIKSARKYKYKNTKYYSIDIWSDKFNQYTAIQFHLNNSSFLKI